MTEIRPFSDGDLKKVLELFKDSDSTQRSPETWIGNDMTAMLALDNERLVGAIPFEPRSISFNTRDFLDVLWVSGAHVEPRQRNQGIGSAMDNKIKDYFSPNYKAVLVYRHDENSPAYRWYKKNGYQELLPIVSLKQAVKPVAVKLKYNVLQTQAEIQQWESKIYACFKCYSDGYGGFPKRHSRFWSEKTKKHYYKDFYSYSLLIPAEGDILSGYAFIGKTEMKDGVKRLDILELAVPSDSSSKNNLYAAIMDFAGRKEVAEVRIQISSQDPELSWLESLGFTYRWKTNILGKLLDPVTYFSEILSDRTSIGKDHCFNVRTPNLGNFKAGQGKNSLTLSIDDETLSKMLMCRCDIGGSIAEGKIIVPEGKENAVDILKSLFDLKEWRYFHIDYI